MKKRSFVFALLVLSLAVFLFNSISAQLMTATLNNPTTYGQDNQFQIYNITVNNTNSPSGINFTVVNLTASLSFLSSIASFNTSTNATNSSYIGTTTGTLTWTNNSVGGLIANGTVGYFWFNASVNQTGYFNITVTTLDTAGNTNSTNVTVLVNDTIAPAISFVPPTPPTTINYSYIQVNVSASDFGTGLQNITIYLYNSTYGLLQSNSSTFTAGNYSSVFFINYTGIADGTYYFNATAFDNASNSNSTALFGVTINTTATLSCNPHWTVTWGSCVNGIQSQIWTDSNNCGTTVGEPSSTNQTCVSNSGCVTNFNCTVSSCINGTQTRTCVDVNNCSAEEVTQVNCSLGSSLTSPQSNSGGLSSSTTFYIVVGIIILGIVGVVFVLMRLKKKASSSNFGGSNTNTGYKTYSPRGPPGPPGYPQSMPPNQPQNPASQQAYQNDFRNY